MTLLSPAALWWGLLAIPIVSLYVLRLRRQERPISSTLLWRRAVEDVQANAPWQRLRPNLLLLLQLLALAAVILVLARPAVGRAHGIAADVIVIVDRSYGMQAADLPPSRFAGALRQAHTLAADLVGGNVMSVIGMGAQPRLAIAESSDRAALDRAIDSLQPTLAPPNFLAALSLASSLARGGQATRVVVLTSRQSGIAGLPLAVPFPVQVIRLGGRLHDLGITALSATRSGRHAQVLLRVGNFGDSAARSDLDLWLDGQLTDVRPLSVPANSQRTLVWTDLPTSIHTVHASLTHRDDVTADKSAWAVLSRPYTRHVLLVAPQGDYFLHQALASVPHLQVTTATVYRPAQRADLVILDGYRPAGLPAAPTWLIDPPPGRVGPLRVGRTQGAGDVLPARAVGPVAGILRGLDLSDVHVAAAATLHGPPWLQPLAVTVTGAPLLAAGDSGTRRLAVTPFSLERSDWPLRVSFPLVVQNVVRYLAPDLVASATVMAGRPLRFHPAPGVTHLAVTLPNGRAEIVPAPVPFTRTEQPGLYRVRAPGRAPLPIAVDFFPARPAPVAGPAVQRWGRPASRTTRTVPLLAGISWVFWLLAMTLLSAEWYFAFRG